MIEKLLPTLSDDDIEEYMDGHKMPWVNTDKLHTHELIIDSFTEHVINEVLGSLQDKLFQSVVEYVSTVGEAANLMRKKYRPQVIRVLKRQDFDRAMAGEKHENKYE